MCAPAVVVEDVGGAFEVGNGAGDFEDAVVGAGAHVHALHGVAQFLEAGGVGLGVFVEQGGGHLGIAVDAGFVLEAALLQHPRGDDALADDFKDTATEFRQFIQAEELAPFPYPSHIIHR